MDAIFAAAAALPDQPDLYREGREPGTREMVVLPNYIVICRIGLNLIEILDVAHARQRRP